MTRSTRKRHRRRHSQLIDLPIPKVERIRLAADEPEITVIRGDLCPGGIKSIVVQFMVSDLYQRAIAGRWSTFTEATSGTTGLNLAMLGGRLGFRTVIFMPDSTHPFIVDSIRLAGGEVRLTPASEGMPGAIEAAQKAAEAPGWVALRQFHNPMNPEAHRQHTAGVVLRALAGRPIGALVCGTGTAGTLVGLANGFADGGFRTTACIARPKHAGRHGTAVPGVLDGYSAFLAKASVARLEEIDIPQEEAIETARRLIRKGHAVGPSSGMNFRAAVEIARRHGPGACIVTVFPDAMWRYQAMGTFGTPAA